MAPAPLFRTWNKTIIFGATLLFLGFLLALTKYTGTDTPSSIYHNLFPGEKDGLDPTVNPAPESLHTHASATKNKAIITSVQKQDESTADWILDLLPDWEPVIYVTDRTSDEAATTENTRVQHSSLTENRGREASVYLSYIINHYYNLPDYMVFIHGKRYQVHAGML